MYGTNDNALVECLKLRTCCKIDSSNTSVTIVEETFRTKTFDCRLNVVGLVFHQKLENEFTFRCEPVDWDDEFLDADKIIEESIAINFKQFWTDPKTDVPFIRASGTFSPKRRFRYRQHILWYFILGFEQASMYFPPPAVSGRSPFTWRRLQQRKSRVHLSFNHRVC